MTFDLAFFRRQEYRDNRNRNCDGSCDSALACVETARRVRPSGGLAGRREAGRPVARAPGALVSAALTPGRRFPWQAAAPRPPALWTTNLAIHLFLVESVGCGVGQQVQFQMPAPVSSPVTCLCFSFLVFKKEIVI